MFQPMFQGFCSTAGGLELVIIVAQLLDTKFYSYSVKFRRFEGLGKVKAVLQGSYLH